MELQMGLHMELHMELHMGLHMELHMELHMRLHMELHMGSIWRPIWADRRSPSMLISLHQNKIETAIYIYRNTDVDMHAIQRDSSLN